MNYREFIKKNNLDFYHQNIKNKQCPYCKKFSTLIFYGFLKGNNDLKRLSIIKRAKRIFCNNRKKAAGCGKTFSLYFITTIPNITISSTSALNILQDHNNGVSIENCYYNIWGRTRLSLSSIFHFWIRFKHNLCPIRTNLCNVTKPTISFSNILGDTIFHLQNCFKENNTDTDLIALYQEKYQTSFC